MKRIMALIDFSEATSGVIGLARDLARAFGCELVLVNVVEAPSDFIDDQSAVDAVLPAHSTRTRNREMKILGLELQKEGVNVATQITVSPRNSVGAKIVHEMARLTPDLVVMGSQKHGSLHQFLCRSVADTVLRKAACPVTIVPREMKR